MPIPLPQTGRCLYPIGDPLKPETFHWCGAVRRHESYCSHHQALTRMKGSKAARDNEAAHDFTLAKANRRATEEFLGLAK